MLVLPTPSKWPQKIALEQVAIPMSRMRQHHASFRVSPQMSRQPPTMKLAWLSRGALLNLRVVHHLRAMWFRLASCKTVLKWQRLLLPNKHPPKSQNFSPVSNTHLKLRPRTSRVLVSIPMRLLPYRHVRCRAHREMLWQLPITPGALRCRGLPPHQMVDSSLRVTSFSRA